MILSGLVWGGSGVQIGLQDGMYVCVCVSGSKRKLTKGES